jgi:hypothetical protein
MNLVTEWNEWRPYASWQCAAPAHLRCMNNISVNELFIQLENALNWPASTGTTGSS